MTVLISSDIQKASPGELITLFQLDCSSFSDEAGTLYFTPSALTTSEIVFDGKTYTPIDIEAEGFEWSGNSAFPNPKLRITNVHLLASALVITYQDLIGAEVRRIRTFRQYLDNGATPDPDQIFDIDVFKVEQKTIHNQTMIEWKLSTAIDQENALLPSEQLVRDYCTRLYRRNIPNSTSFDYSKVTCRYAGAAMFTRTNTVTTNPALDVCAKTLNACKLRFGAENPLPFKGCPGLGRMR